MSVLLFLLLTVVAGLAGFSVLAALGLEHDEAWAAGRVLGLVLVVFPAWWWGAVGLPNWQVVAVLGLGCGGCVGLYRLIKGPVSWRSLLTVEAVFWGATLLVLVMRLGHPEILNTEKPMDLGILATLLRAEAFPPPDMWLAGETLPYYYWGSLLWTLPLSLSNIPLEYGYNLIVAMVGGLVAALAWVLGRRLSDGGWGAGLTAAFLVVFAGTPDGLRQVLAGIDPRFVNLWDSSRQVPHTITEFPLFTVWLGDLHPHLLSLPLALAALVVALFCGRSRPRIPGVAVVGLLFGITWAANPWAMPPTLAVIGVVMLCGDGRWHWPVGAGVVRWLAVAAVGLGGWIATAPFHLAFHPPFDGIGLVRAWTRPHDLLLYAGCLLIPVFAAAVALLRGSDGDDRARSLMRILGLAALAVVCAVATGRATLILLVGGLGILVAAVLGSEDEPRRTAFAVGAVGLFLFLAPEVVFVRDAYGDDLHRMNTVFKAYFQGWALLGIAVPAMLARTFASSKPRHLMLLLLCAAAVPHTATALYGSVASRDRGLDGLRWLSEGDRQLVFALRSQKAGTTIVEAVGDPYTTFGRLSSASGTPALLGWANHELVWRGQDIHAETQRRAAVVRKIYSSGDPGVVRQLVADEGVDLVAIGDLENRQYSAEGLAALRAAGAVEFESGEHALIRFDREGEDG